MKSEDIALFEAGESYLANRSEDALDHAVSIEDHKDVTGLDTYYVCGGCDFPHLSEQQAINCCPPRQVWVCPNESCGRLCDSDVAARECCS